MKSLTLVSFLCFGLGFAVAVQPAAAAEKTGHLGTFGDWEAYAESENGAPVCFMGSKPTKAEGKYTQRGDTFMLVTHRPKDKAFDTVNVEAGYAYKDGGEVTVTVGTQKFALFTKGGQAWARDAATDKALVQAMRAGSTMIVDGASSRGTATKDTYSLKGFTAAHQAISKACGAK